MTPTTDLELDLSQIEIVKADIPLKDKTSAELLEDEKNVTTPLDRPSRG